MFCSFILPLAPFNYFNYLVATAATT